MKKKLKRKVTGKRYWIFFTLIFFSFTCYAQTHSITGKITSADNSKPLPGVNVRVKDSSTGTVSGIDGSYTISAKSGDVLIFSFVSYSTQQIYIGQTSTINVALKPSTSDLNEVVVIGYGTKKRGDLTGSVSSVTAADIVKTQPTTIDQALQGRVAGVVVQQVSGQPGGDVNVQIRGLGGFTGSPPLYVIDGIQIPPNAQSPIPGNGTNPLSSINPSDIASIDVLKDASATAIYGSQASNGVIIITTKKGVSGPPLVSYDGYEGWQKLPKYYDVMDLRQYATFMNEKGAIIGYDLRPQFANPQYLGVGTNWQKALYRTAPMLNHNVAVSGGDARTKYYLSGTYFSQEGIALGSDFKRTSVKANIDNKTTDWLRIGTNIQLAHVAENVATTNTGVILQALNQTPDVNVVNPDGTWGGNDPNIYGAIGTNPFAIATIVKDFKSRYQLFGNAYAEIQFTRDLSLRNEVSGNFDFATEDYFNPTYTMGAYTKTTNSGTSTSAQNFYNSITNYLTYNHTFNSKYYINLTAGHEAQLLKNNSVSATRTNFASNNVQTISSGDGTTATNTGTKGQGSLEAYFGRANFTYDDKYLLTATVRHDGSSKFAPANRWNTTYSGALAWKVNHEALLKDIKAINDLKLRIGYGLVNNQNISEYAYGSTLTTVATGLSGNSQLTATTGNPDIKWETTKSYNVGLDASILNNRITFTVDAYYRKTSNLLLSLTEPFYSGTFPNGGYSPGAVQAPYVNIGSVSNKGIEFSLSTVNIRSKDFNWRTNLTFSQNKNKVLALVDGTPAIYGAVTKTVVGRSIGEFYGYQSLGIYKNAADFTKYPALSQNGNGSIPITPGSGGVWVGDVIFKDINKDGKIDANDQTFLGSPLPKFQYGINNSFSYKNIDLNVFMTGNYGNKIYNQLKVNGNNPNQNFGYFADVINYAKIGLINPTGSASDINNVYITNPETNITRISQSSGNDNQRFSDRYIESGSFLKCKSIALGYSFSNSLLNRIHLKSLRVYVNVTNVFTITKYTGYDPEIGSWNPLAAGIDNGYYAQPRVYTVGLNVSLNN
ncbi:SusC/RagA family TonB-linked outer membrane protein [Mucilaginibacter lappiensis]|uniref:TonB-linked SusC/RagA family outer membrane protein n=1 Tax=Mucilaginibacter lappiensis TaxID=354630 RepID=A0A841JQV2_9SPHI|nr:TonB-dependent receptor [Mucilaginibacter lappiensis]MBB6131138.1 TonB-linked SusC/RagA family outer membrane protein [Mucilaginibacter lappiensis]